MISNAKLLVTNENPFINMCIFAFKNKMALDEDMVNLFLSFIKNDLHKKYNINENFLIDGITKTNYPFDIKNHIYSTNIFFLFSSLESNLEPIKFKNFFNILIENGLNITFETKKWDAAVKNNNDINNLEKIPYVLIDSIFSNITFSEPRSLYLLDKIFQLIPKEEYENRIKKNNSFHSICSHNFLKIIELFGTQKINPDITNKDLLTPLMYCRNLITIKTLDLQNPNWFLKNIEGKDAISFFNNISDKEEKLLVQDFYKEKMIYLVNNSTNKIENQHYIDKRLEQSLCELIISDETKKNLQDFIKKNKIKNLDTIVDKNNNTLAMLCLKKEKFSRYELFKNCNHANENNNKENILTILLNSSYNCQYKNIAPILENVFKTPNFISKNLCNNIIENSFNSYTTVCVFPDWFKKEHIIHEILKPLNFSTEELKHIYYKIHSNKPTNLLEENSNSFYDVYTMIHSKLSKDTLLDNNILIDNIFSIHNLIDINYYINQDKLTILSSLLTNVNKNLSDLSYSENLINELTNKSLSFIINGFNEHHAFSYELTEEEHKKNCQNDFCKKLEPLLQFFIKENKLDIFYKIPKEILSNENWNYDIKKVIQYCNLNNILEKKNNTTYKKIKI